MIALTTKELQMKLLIVGMSLITVFTTTALCNAEALKWDHNENIRQAIELFHNAVTQGGMTEAETVSKDCYVNSTKGKNSQLLEMCAAFDITAMFIDSAAYSQPNLQRKYFQVGTVDTRLRKQLAKFGHKKKVQEEIITFWGTTTKKLLDERNQKHE